jgi:hypothetical protein
MNSIELYTNVKIYHHKTHELVNIIKDKCDLIITMNMTRSLAKSLIGKNTKVYFVSCSRDIEDLTKNRYFLGCSHLKLYRTNDKVFISTSNLSLSSWDEMTVELKRNRELDNFIKEIESNLKIKSNFYKEFW